MVDNKRQYIPLLFALKSKVISLQNKQQMLKKEYGINN